MRLPLGSHSAPICSRRIGGKEKNHAKVPSISGDKHSSPSKSILRPYSSLCTWAAAIVFLTAFSLATARQHVCQPYRMLDRYITATDSFILARLPVLPMGYPPNSPIAASLRNAGFFSRHDKNHPELPQPFYRHARTRRHCRPGTAHNHNPPSPYLSSVSLATGNFSLPG